MLGTAPSSPGFDVFILSICLICYGVNTAVQGQASSKATAVEDDLDDDASRKKQKPGAGDDELDKILRRLFGHNVKTVRKIFETCTAYADCFKAVNDPWTHTTTAYKEERASNLYWAGLRQLKAMNIMSNVRCDSDYFPLVAYVASQQMALRGDLWPYSTRAVEGRGGRYKRIDRRIVCKRKRAKEASLRCVRNKKHGTISFKKQSYKSTRTVQLLRTSCSQEESGHAQHGRARLRTTGRKTLSRNLPKWQTDELPVMGRLMDPVALEEILVLAARQFTDLVNFKSAACLKPPGA